MRANDIIKAAEKIADEKKLKEEKKQALLVKREEIIKKKNLNKNFCAKKDGKCHAFDLKEYSVCQNILKSHCGKQACRNAAGEKPKMYMHP